MNDAFFEHWLKSLADIPETMQGILFGEFSMFGDELDL
jgi:hypothetical protein